MNTSKLLIAAAALLLPTSAQAVSSSQCSTAMDIDTADLVAGSLQYTYGVQQMVDVTSGLGQFGPFEGPTLCLLSTGDPSNIYGMTDYDWPGTGADTSAGDRIEISWQMTVPPWANSFFFRHNFFSREYPEWVGSAYNDTFEIHLTGSAWSGQMVFDSVGNPITVNTAFFVVTNPADLVGTGFDQDGATGWLVTAAPVTPGDVITLSATVYDVADGVWDSAALLDDFEWSTSQISAPYTDFADPEGGFQNPPPPSNPDEPSLAYLSPKEAPRAGGGTTTVIGTLFHEGTTVEIGGASAPVVELVDENTLIVEIPTALAAGAPDGGPVDVRIANGLLQATLLDGFTYHQNGSAGVRPGAPTETPAIDLVWPTTVQPGTATQIRLTGTAIAGGAVEIETVDGVTTLLDTLQEEAGPIDVITADLPALDAGVYAVRVRLEDTTAVWDAWLDVQERAVAPDEAAGCATAGRASTAVWMLVLLVLIGRFQRLCAPGSSRS